MILLSLLTASAFEVELAGEVGSQHNGDRAYDLFSDGNALPSVGLRAGARPGGAQHVPVGVVASWHHNSRGSWRYADEASYVAAFTVDTFGLGVKLDADIGEVFAPYVAAQTLLVRGLARFDDDPTDRHSPGQTKYAGVAPGLLAVGGVEVSSPDFASFPGEVFLHLEVGYGAIAPLQLGELGSMAPHGVAVRSGIGMRFGRSGS